MPPPPHPSQALKFKGSKSPVTSSESRKNRWMYTPLRIKKIVLAEYKWIEFHPTMFEIGFLNPSKNPKVLLPDRLSLIKIFSSNFYIFCTMTMAKSHSSYGSYRGSILIILFIIQIIQIIPDSYWFLLFLRIIPDPCCFFY